MKSETDVRNRLAELNKQYTEAVKHCAWHSADRITEQIRAISWVLD